MVTSLVNRVWNPFYGYNERRGESREAFKITTAKGFVLYVPVGETVLTIKDLPDLPKSHAIYKGPKRLVPSLLNVGDMLKLNVGWEAPSTPYDITEQGARAIGYYIGYGTLIKGRVRVRSRVESVRNDFAEYAESLGCTVRTTGNVVAVRGMEPWLQKHGLVEGKWNYAWMNMSNKHLRALLASVWSVRGNMIFKIDGRVHIGLKLRDDHMLRGVQIALLRLGVVADHKGFKDDWYHLDISPMKIAKDFATKIGPIAGQEEKCKRVMTLSEGRVTHYEWDRIVELKRLESHPVATLGGVAGGFITK